MENTVTHSYREYHSSKELYEDLTHLTGETDFSQLDESLNSKGFCGLEDSDLIQAIVMKKDDTHYLIEIPEIPYIPKKHIVDGSVGDAIIMFRYQLYLNSNCLNLFLQKLPYLNEKTLESLRELGYVV